MAKRPKAERRKVDLKEWNDALMILDTLGADIAAIVNSVKKEDRFLVVEMAKSLEKLKETYPHFWDEKKVAAGRSERNDESK